MLNYEKTDYFHYQLLDLPSNLIVKANAFVLVYQSHPKWQAQFNPSVGNSH